MPETTEGVKFSQFPYASPEVGDVVVGLHHTGNTDNNAKFTITAFITKIKEEVVSQFVPSTRRVNNKELSTDIYLSASDIGAQGRILVSGILKGDGSGGVTAAQAGTDYAPAGYGLGVKLGTLTPIAEFCFVYCT